MALPSSGAMTIGNISVELGLVRTSQRSLGESTTRSLYGIPSGAIRLAADGYGAYAYDAPGSADYTAPGTYSFLIPKFQNYLQVEVWGGGGAGGQFVSGGAYAPSGGTSQVNMPNGQQLIAYGGGGGQNAYVDRFGGNTFGAGGGGGGATGGNVSNLTGGSGYDGSLGSIGGYSPDGGATTAEPPFDLSFSGYNGNFPGGGGSSFRADISKYPAFGGGGGGGGYSKSSWNTASLHKQTMSLTVGAGGSGSVTTGASGRIYIIWG